jgi:hypothetical protein
MKNSPATRRRFMAHFAGLGLGSTLLPGVLWGQVNQSGQGRVTAEMLKAALALSGLEFDAEARNAMLRGVNQNLERYERLRNVDIPDDVGPPFHFTALVPGMTVDRTRRPFRMSADGLQPALRRQRSHRARQGLPGRHGLSPRATHAPGADRVASPAGRTRAGRSI